MLNNNKILLSFVSEQTHDAKICLVGRVCHYILSINRCELLSTSLCCCIVLHTERVLVLDISLYLRNQYIIIIIVFQCKVVCFHFFKKRRSPQLSGHLLEHFMKSEVSVLQLCLLRHSEA